MPAALGLGVLRHGRHGGRQDLGGGGGERLQQPGRPGAAGEGAAVAGGALFVPTEVLGGLDGLGEGHVGQQHGEGQEAFFLFNIMFTYLNIVTRYI